jgi:hypothetical protein
MAGGKALISNCLFFVMIFDACNVLGDYWIGRSLFFGFNDLLVHLYSWKQKKDKKNRSSGGTGGAI